MYKNGLFNVWSTSSCTVFSALTLLVGHQEKPVKMSDKVLVWSCLAQGANDLHLQLMPLPSLTSLKSRMV